MGRAEAAPKVALASGCHHIGGEVRLLAPWANRLLLDTVVCIQGYDVLKSVLLCHDGLTEGGCLLLEPAARNLLISRIFAVGTLQREEQEGETGFPPEPRIRRHIFSSQCQQGRKCA